MPWPAELDGDDEDDLEAINTWFQEQSDAKLLGQVLDESRESYARLAEAVQQLPDEALTDPAYFAWTDGLALGAEILNGGYFDHLHGEHEATIRQWLAERPSEPEGSGAQIEL